MSAAPAADRQHPLVLLVAAALLVACAITIITFSIERYEGATLLLAYAGGMAMLLTPCRFPVILGIVPLCKRGHPARGVALALLFGLGLMVTQALWGVVIAGIGEVFGLREVARYLSLAGGAVAYAFGLSMLGLVNLPVPSGTAWQPSGMPGKSEYVGAFFMGLLLGNTGLCCPDPVFLSMTPYIATRGLGDGALLAAVYGLGRATPLVAIVMLARGGVDALQLAVRHKRAFDRTLAWALLATGTFTIYGYSGVAYDLWLAVALMLVPAVAYHVKIQSALPRAAAWAAATVAGTLIGVRVMYWMLVNLP